MPAFSIELLGRLRGARLEAEAAANRERALTSPKPGERSALLTSPGGPSVDSVVPGGFA